MKLERELLAAELARYDVDAEQIEVEGVRYHPVWVDTETYLTAAGEVQVERHLYRPAGHNAKSICPLELRVGIVDGYWTPRAARQGAWVTAQLPPGDAEALFVELGAMSPSRSTLDRLPRELSRRWEIKREAWEVAVRAQETVAEAAVSVAFSLDGVMVAMKAKAAERVAKQAEAGKHASGPAGRQEAACGAVSLYAAEGERLQTIRYARMPESKKVTLQAQLQGEIEAVYALRPDLRRVHLADGAETNWDRLAEIEAALGLPPEGRVKIVDFYHGCDHLKNGCDAIWGREHAAQSSRVPPLENLPQRRRRRGRPHYSHLQTSCQSNHWQPPAAHSGRTHLFSQSAAADELSRVSPPELADCQRRRGSGLQNISHSTPETLRHGLDGRRRTGDLDLPQSDPERALVARLEFARG